MRSRIVSIVGAFALAGCTAAQQAAFATNVATFNNDVALIDFDHRHGFDGAGEQLRAARLNRAGLGYARWHQHGGRRRPDRRRRRDRQLLPGASGQYHHSRQRNRLGDFRRQGGGGRGQSRKLTGN